MMDPSAQLVAHVVFTFYRPNVFKHYFGIRDSTILYLVGRNCNLNTFQEYRRRNSFTEPFCAPGQQTGLLNKRQYSKRYCKNQGQNEDIPSSI